MPRKKTTRRPLKINPDTFPPPIPRQQQEQRPVPSESRSQPPLLPAPPPNDPLSSLGAESGFSEPGVIDASAVPAPTGYDDAAGAAATEPPGPGEPSLAAEPAGPAPLEFELWYRSACMAFRVVSAIAKLKSLAFDPAAIEPREAFKAVYDTATETPSLRFLVMPQGKWIARVGAVAAFALPMAQAVRAELAQRRAGAAPPDAPPRASDSERPAAAPTGQGGQALPAAFVAAMAGGPA